MSKMLEKNTYVGGTLVSSSEAVTRDSVRPAAVKAQGGEWNTVYKQTTQEGIRGTLLPSSKGETGGSTGFDPHEKLDITVCNLETKESFVVPAGATFNADMVPSVQEYEALTPLRRAELQEAFKRSIQAPAPVPSLQGVSIGNDEFLDSVMTALESHPGVAKPLETLSDSVARQRTESCAQSAPFQHDPAQRPCVAPTKRIAFNFGGVIGRIETFYHEIVRNGKCLVLCWDTEWSGTRYVPGFSQGPTDTLQVVVGKEQEELQVLSLGIQFTVPKHRLELTVLIVHNGVDEAETPVNADIHGVCGFGGSHGEVQFM
jgi:hypothetical protein